MRLRWARPLPVFLEGEEGDGQGMMVVRLAVMTRDLDGLASGDVVVFPLVQSDGQGVPGGVFDHDGGRK